MHGRVALRRRRTDRQSLRASRNRRSELKSRRKWRDDEMLMTRLVVPSPAIDMRCCSSVNWSFGLTFVRAARWRERVGMCRRGDEVKAGSERASERASERKEREEFLDLTLLHFRRSLLTQQRTATCRRQQPHRPQSRLADMRASHSRKPDV